MSTITIPLATFDAMRETLEDLAAILPLEQDTVRTSYGVCNSDRDAIHAALTAAKAVQPKAQGGEPVARVVAIRLMDFFATVQYTPLQNGNPPFDINSPLYTTPQEPAAAIPEGWKLVRIEPTHEQAKAAADAFLDCGSKLMLNKALAAVRAGIAAAPAAPGGAA